MFMLKSLKPVVYPAHKCKNEEDKFHVQLS